jgi:hypothetical protein
MTLREGHFYDMGAPGEAYPEWMAELANACGVYAIRSKKTSEVFYVGESHTGRLRKTLTRHLQSWNTPHWYDEMTGRGGDLAYPREAVEVAVWLTYCDEAQAVQGDVICDLAPRDNTYETSCLVDDGDDAEVPF